MSLKAHFEKLGAPLRNQRWSWGAVRPTDGAVFLRVWQDMVRPVDGRNFVEVWRDRIVTDEELRAAGRERKEHLRLLTEEDRRCYLVMCLARDVKQHPRSIRSFNEKELFVGGEVAEDDGVIRIELQDRIPVPKMLLNGR